MTKEELQQKVNKGFWHHLIHFNYLEMLIDNVESLIDSGIVAVKKIGYCIWKIIVIVLFPLTSLAVVLLLWDRYKELLKNHDKNVKAQMNRLFRKSEND